MLKLGVKGGAGRAVARRTGNHNSRKEVIKEKLRSQWHLHNVIYNRMPLWVLKMVKCRQDSININLTMKQIGNDFRLITFQNI
jgi:hypothetical protein